MLCKEEYGGISAYRKNLLRNNRLPIYPGMPIDHQEEVVLNIKNIFQNNVKFNKLIILVFFKEKYIMKNSQILITGGCGYIGSHTLSNYLKRIIL